MKIDYNEQHSTFSSLMKLLNWKLFFLGKTILGIHLLIAVCTQLVGLEQSYFQRHFSDTTIYSPPSFFLFSNLCCSIIGIFCIPVVCLVQHLWYDTLKLHHFHRTPHELPRNGYKYLPVSSCLSTIYFILLIY